MALIDKKDNFWILEHADPFFFVLVQQVWKTCKSYTLRLSEEPLAIAISFGETLFQVQVVL